MKKYFYLILIILFSATAFFGLVFYNDNYIQRPRVIFFNVGEGDGAMIDVGNNMQILIDGGNGKNILDKLGKYMPFYDREIELMIMTHPDKDHMGGLAKVLKYYKVDQVLETGIACKTAICHQWNKLIAEKNVFIKYAKFGQKIKMNNVELNILYPFENLKDKKVKNDNNTSIVLKVNLKNNFYLFTGDAQFEVEKKLINKNINIKADILKVSHHGSKNATSTEFLKFVKPQKAIISVGKNNYGHPTKELLNRLKNMNIKIFRTDRIGDIIFE